MGVTPSSLPGSESISQSRAGLPTPLLAFLVESGLFSHLKVCRALIVIKKLHEVWFPGYQDLGCSIIGKFTQGYQAEGKKKTDLKACDRLGRA